MIHLRKYATASEVYVPLVATGTADFKSNPTIASGDFTLEVDGVDFGVADTLPTLTPAAGYIVKIPISVAETTGETLIIRIIDAAGAEWEDQMVIVETYGHASARHPFDLGTAMASQTVGTTTTNTDMRGTDSAALASVCTETRLAALTDWLNGGRLDLLIDAIKVVTDALPNAGALTDISTSTDRLTAVRAAILTDWINGGRLDLLLDAIPTTAMRGTDNAALASVCTEPRLAELDAANLPTDVAAIPTTAMRGTDSAALASVCTEPRLAELDAANLPTDVAAIPTTAMRGTDSAATAANLATVDTVVDGIQTDLSNGTDGLGALKTLLDAIPTTAMRGTDGANTTTPPTAAAIADAVLDEALADHVAAGSLSKKVSDIPTTAMRGTDSASTHDAAAVVTALMADTTDGVTLTSILTVTMAALFGVATVSGSTVTFMGRDGVTPALTVVVGGTAGERDTSTIA